MSAFEASAEIADTVRRCCAAVPVDRLLVVALDDLDASDFSEVAHESAIRRLPENSVQAEVREKPGRHPAVSSVDQAFDVVVLYRLTNRGDDLQRLLRKVARVIQPEGEVVVVAHDEDFSFAPLPDVGGAHLLRRWLREAGFAEFSFPRLPDSRVVAVAHASRVPA